MPTTYAHWRFGQDCLETMPDDLKEIVKNNIDIYNLGVHGPDILFYDLINKEVAAYGNELHYSPARDFFEKCKEAYQTHEEKDEMLAYLLGFLSHFTLDSNAHGYVAIKVEVSGVSHNAIEADWDGHLIIQDGRMVNMTDRAESLRPNRKIAKVISYFFPFETKDIYRAIKLQHFFIHLLNYISLRRYEFLKTLTIKLKLYDYTDLLISPIEIEECMDSNMRLDKIRAKAKKQYPKLLKNLLAYLNSDKPLPAYFNHTFEKWPDYQSIPVLSVDEEEDYIV